MDKKYLVQLNNEVIGISMSSLEGQSSVYVHDDLTEEGTDHVATLEPVGLSGLYLLMIDKVPYELHIESKGEELEIVFGRETFLVNPIPWIDQDSVALVESNDTSDSVLTAFMAGVVGEVLVSNGDSVKSGEVLLIIESMKMNNEITAPTSGNIEGLNLDIGAQVEEGEILLRISST